MAKEKRYEPTAKRIRRASRDGNVPQSRRAVAAIQVTIGVPFIFYLLAELLSDLAGISKSFVTAEDFGTKIMLLSVADGSSAVLWFCLKSGCVISTCGVFAAMAVRGFAFVIIPPRLSWKIFDPGFGIRHTLGIAAGQTGAASVIVSVTGRIAQLTAVLVLLFAGAIIAAQSFLPLFGDGFIDDIGNLADFDFVRRDHQSGIGMVPYLFFAVLRLLRPFLAVCLLVGVAEALIVRRRWRRGLMMDESEVKEELREQEGDPLVVGMRRQLHREIALHDVIENVRNSDVVVVSGIE